MKYKPPIKVEIEDMAYNITRDFDDNIVANASYELGFSIDKHELVKALEYDREQYYKGYADRDAEIIRCKDCANSELMVGGTYACELGVMAICNKADDYCSWAKRKDEEE